MRCVSTEGPRNSSLPYGQWSRYHITVCQSTKLHMRSIGWHKCFDFIKYRSQIPRRNTIILNFVKALPGTTTCYISTTDFLTLPISCKLKKAPWPDEYSVDAVERDNHLKCELHIRLKFSQQLADCLMLTQFASVSDESVIVLFSLLNVCNTVQQIIDTNVMLSKGKWNLREFCVNLISIIVCAVACKLLSARILNLKFGRRSEAKLYRFNRRTAYICL